MTRRERHQRFGFEPMEISGVVAVRRQRQVDSRGSLGRLFCMEEFSAAGWTKPVAQINHSYTRRKGTVRGLHFQHPPHAEAKVVMCLRGAVHDVAVDLRSGSSTFLRWCARELSEENQTALLIPAGCAHGFQALTANVELLYLHSAAYEPGADDGLRATDPRLGIEWPLPVSGMSPRDADRALLTESFTGLDLKLGWAT